jgi:YVTN family beta-propeller protein
MKAIDTIKVGQGPHGLRPSPDGRWLVVANVADTTLSVIDTRTNQLVTDVEVGKAPAQVAFSPDGRFVYASLNGEDAVAKVDMTSRKLVGTVAVGDGPIQTYVSGDNRYLLVANQGTEDSPGTAVSVIDIKTFTVTATVETGQGSHGVVVDPSSQHAYVTNIYGDDVAVLDLQELEVVARIPVGDKPNGVSLSPLPNDAEDGSVTLDLSTDPEVPADEIETDHGDGHQDGH